MKNRRNYYRILQVQCDAPREVIRASYRTLMRELKEHPDLGGSTSNAALLNEAYETLNNADRREEYDRVSCGKNSRKNIHRSEDSRSSDGAACCPFCRATLPEELRESNSCPTCQSPLQGASRSKSEAHQRRSIDRMRKGGRIMYYTSWPAEARPGRLVDLSRQGLRFMSAEQALPGAVVKIVHPHFRATATVRNVRQSRDGDEPTYAIGVSFLAVEFAVERGAFLSVTA